MVDFIGIARIQELVARRGAARFIEELAGEIEADFLRWSAFDKSPRHATHSPLGVIELMPASDSRVMALIGNGAQSEFQTIAFHHMLGIREVRLYDTDAGATAKLEHNLARLQLPELRVLRCGSSAEAVQGADIVTTVTADKRNA